MKTSSGADGAEIVLRISAETLRDPAARARLARDLCETLRGVGGCACCGPAAGTARAVASLREHLTCASEHADFLAELIGPHPRMPFPMPV